jgi:hypothetical protein
VGEKLNRFPRFLAAMSIAFACDDRGDANERREDAGQRSANSRAAAVARDCGVRQSSVVTGAGIGDLRIGTPVDRLRAECRVTRDTTMERSFEGMPERRITVALNGEAVAATIVEDRVWRIEVQTPRFRTADSLGVGSRARDLKRGPATLATGDRGVFVVRQDHCGLSFQLAGIPPGRGDWARIPDSTPVALVLIFGCGGSG